jgi:hypothetical protein
MNEIADRVLKTYELIGELDEARVALSRERVLQYMDKLASAGHKDQTRDLPDASRGSLVCEIG